MEALVPFVSHLQVSFYNNPLWASNKWSLIPSTSTLTVRFVTNLKVTTLIWSFCPIRLRKKILHILAIGFFSPLGYKF